LLNLNEPKIHPHPLGVAHSIARGFETQCGTTVRLSYPPDLIEITFDEVLVKLPSDYWDLSRALDGVGGDEEFLSELAGIFCAAYPTLQNDLEQSIAAKNYFRVADAAHLLGRAARNIAATKVMEAALVIEMMARRKEFDDIDNAFYALRKEGGQLLDALADFRNGRCGLSGV
jgi:HPt (histidine-containing phosphotransfer) domain-containing protein